MPKDTKSSGYNKAPACESRGFGHKKEGENFDTPSSGENLLTFDHLKIADPEATDDKQFQYPLQMIFNIGLNLNF